MYFLRKGKNMFSGKKIPSLQMIQERSCVGGALRGKTIFSEGSKKISYLHVFFWERSSFIFRLRYKIIFSGKRNIIFPNNARKIIFQHNFFRKTIFSGRLQKGKYGFPCSVRSMKIIIWSRLLYYLFLYLCTRTFFRSVENFPRHGNFMCCSVFRILVSHRVLAQVLIAPVLGLSDVNSMSASESSYFKWNSSNYKKIKD